MTEQWASALWQRFKDHYGQKFSGQFQGPEAIESWRLTWSEINADAVQIRHALSRLGAEFPEWPPTLGQFKALCGSAPRPMLPAPKEERVQPSPERIAEFKEAAAKLGMGTKRFWIPANVVNDSQVNFIVIQAQRFGRDSQAGRFLIECKAAGVITDDNRLVKRQKAAA